MFTITIEKKKNNHMRRSDSVTITHIRHYLNMLHGKLKSK